MYIEKLKQSLSSLLGILILREIIDTNPKVSFLT